MERAGEPGRSGEVVLEVLRRAGAEFRAVHFTDNRRVMVSVAQRGEVIRMHRSFASGPEEVLAAVGVLYARPRRRPAARAAARATLRGFLAARAPAPAPARPRTRRTRAADRPHLERLAAEFERVNRLHFHDALPAVPLHLSDRMKRRNGHFCADPLEIVISRRLLTSAAVGEAEHTLRHEMIHLWQHVTGRRPGHGPDFRRWARALDVHPRATREVRWQVGRGQT